MIRFTAYEIPDDTAGRAIADAIARTGQGPDEGLGEPLLSRRVSSLPNEWSTYDAAGMLVKAIAIVGPPHDKACIMAVHIIDGNNDATWALFKYQPPTGQS